MNYRSDIDGLRAVAVLPVVAFHAQIPFFSGGFVGVDVFFVISGYLISSIILAEVATGNFSLAGFYERRIRRIFPALMAMLVITSLLAYRYLLPAELLRYVTSLTAAMCSMSNLYFWSAAGYFDAAADQQPLLHTWSLSVEEQFYAVFPLFLLTVHRFFPQRLRAVVVGSAAVSFCIAVIGVQIAPQHAFYWLDARAWELLVGTILATNLLEPVRHRACNEVLSAGGLVLIAAGVFGFDTATPFPGAAAAIPALGAALVIHGGRGAATLTRRLLSTKLPVFVGLISYSLYLWHWPLIFFQNNFSIVFEGLPGPLGKMILVVASIGIATLSWSCIERPIRRGRWRPTSRALGWTAGVAVLATGTASLLALLTHGFPGRFSVTELQAASYAGYDAATDYRKGQCFTRSDVGDAVADAELKVDICMNQVIGKKNYLLFGDSYAADLWYGLSRGLGGVNVLQATGAGCKPLRESARVRDTADSRCTRLTRYVFDDYLLQHHVDAVVIAGSWIPGDLPALAATLDWLGLRGIPVVLFGPKIQYDAPLPRLLAASIRSNDSHLPDRHRPAAVETLDKQMAALAATKQVLYVSYFRLLCEAKVCQSADPDGHPLSFDRGHLTRWGSSIVAYKLRELNLP